MQRHDLSPEVETLRPFIVDYPYEGGTETLYLYAYSLEDAERRLCLIAGHSELLGELIEVGEVASMAVN